MKLSRCSQAGTDNREDVKVTLFPTEDGITIIVRSSVSPLFDRQIEEAARVLLAHYNIHACHMEIDDHSALDYVVRARIETAILRATED